MSNPVLTQAEWGIIIASLIDSKSSLYALEVDEDFAADHFLLMKLLPGLGDGLNDIIEKIEAQLAGTPEDEHGVTGLCQECWRQMHLISSPTGSWWAHDEHPEDGHDGNIVVSSVRAK